jgi:hypothetical protein
VSFGIVFSWAFPSQTSYQLGDLTPVKPQSVVITARIDEDFRLPAYRCLLHLPTTARAIAFVF